MRRNRLLGVLLVLIFLAGGLYFAASRVLASDLVRTQLEAQLAASLGQPVHIASASARVFPKVALDLRDVTVGDPAAVRFGSVRLITGLRPLFSRTIDEAEIVIGTSQIEVPQLIRLIASASATTPGAPPSSTAFTVKSIGVISLRDVTLTASGQTLNVDLDSSIDGDRLDIVRLSARAASTRIEGHGALTSLAKLEGQIEAAANPLDLDEMIAIGTALTTAPTSGPAGAAPAAATPMHVTIKLTAPEGKFSTYAFRDLSANADITPAHLALAPLSLGALGGRFQGRVDADTRRAIPVLRLTGRVDGLDMSDVMKAAGSPGSLTGRLGGTVALTAEGTDPQVLMRTAHGTIAAVITDGTMPGLDLVRPIVLAFGKPSGAPPAGSGSTFSRLGGSFALANSTLTSENLSLASRDFDLQGRGSLRMASGDVSAATTVMLSPELTAQAGTDLRRYAQDNGRVSIPATISGPIAKPRVSLDVAALTKRAITNELQRRATSFLGGLFKKKSP